MSKIVAHRGFSSRRLENTMASFELAFREKYVDIVELDIRMTKDKKIVCIHDGFIKNPISEKEYIKDKTYEELTKKVLKTKDFYIDLFKYASRITSFRNLFKLLRYRKKKGKMPLLSDVLDILPSNKEVIIEIKGSSKDYEGNSYEEEILKVIDQYKNKNISIMSFNKDIVMSIKEKRKKLKAGILIDKNIEYIDLPVEFVSFSKKIITEELILKVLKSKKEVVVWTINTYSDYLLLKRRCAKYINKIAITTDFPDLMYHLLKRDFAVK